MSSSGSAPSRSKVAGMDSHERHLLRIAEIEGVSRYANEKIVETRPAAADDAPEDFRCECGDETCAAPLSIPRSLYERVREDPMQFVVTPEHIVPEAETVKQRGEGYWILYKNEEVRRVVEASDPRTP
jgi:hypothetical protein